MPTMPTMPTMRSPVTDNPKEVAGSLKLSYTVVPTTSRRALAVAHSCGNAKYGYLNWRAAGVDTRTYLDALDRHVTEFREWLEGNYEGNGLATVNREVYAATAGEVDPVTGHFVHYLGAAMASLSILHDAAISGMLTDSSSVPEVFPSGPTVGPEPEANFNTAAFEAMAEELDVLEPWRVSVAPVSEVAVAGTEPDTRLCRACAWCVAPIAEALGPEDTLEGVTATIDGERLAPVSKHKVVRNVMSFDNYVGALLAEPCVLGTPVTLTLTYVSGRRYRATVPAVAYSVDGELDKPTIVAELV